MKLDVPAADMTEWSAMVDKVMNLKKQVKISLVGKYVELQDAYISVVEALKHSGYANDAEVKINWVNANDVTAEMWQNSLEMRMGSLSRWFWSTGNRRKNSSHQVCA